jgi:hypothetical protein
MRVVMLIVGLALLGVGLGLGLVPANATTAIPGSPATPARVDSYSCGSPWAVDHDAIDKQQGVNDLTAMEATVVGNPTVAENATGLCDRAFGARGLWGGVLAVLGALALLGLGLVVAAQRGRREAAPPAADGPDAVA